MNIALTGGMTLKKLITAIIMLTAAVLLLCACTPEQPTVQPTQTQSGQTEQATPSGREFLYDKNGNVIQQPQVRDYTAMWWRDGFNRGGKWQMNMQTGYYGMSVSTLTGTLNTFGAIEQEISESEAGKANNELIDSLAHIRTRFAVIDESGERCGYSGMEAVGGRQHNLQDIGKRTVYAEDRCDEHEVLGHRQAAGAGGVCGDAGAYVHRVFAVLSG